MNISSSLFLILSVLCVATEVVTSARTQRKLKKYSPKDKPGKDYWKAKRYFKKFAKLQPPTNDYYLFYTYEQNCRLLEPINILIPVTECDLVAWNGTIIGTVHSRCYVIGELDPTIEPVCQDPGVACDRFRKFLSGNYFFEKFLQKNSEPFRKSLIVGGTGTFVGATGESIMYQPYGPQAILDFALSGEPLPPVPHVWFVKSLNAKEVAFDFWKDFDSDCFSVTPPDFTVFPEWYTNKTNTNLTMTIPW